LDAPHELLGKYVDIHGELVAVPTANPTDDEGIETPWTVSFPGVFTQVHG
jgi:hypothetical protein